MKEILLSFDNNEVRRKVELAFKYRYCSILKEYVFEYQRDGITLNLEYLKELVALSKKATSFSLLYLQTLQHHEHLKINNNTIKLSLSRPFAFFPINNFIGFTKKYRLNLIQYLIFNRISMRKPIFRFDPILATPDGNYLNTIENFLLKLTNKSKLDEYKSNFYQIYNIFSEFENVSVKNLDDLRKTNVLENFYVNKYNCLRYIDNLFLQHDKNGLYIYKFETVNDETNNINIFEQIYTQTETKDMNIFENITIKNNYSNILNIFENINGYLGHKSLDLMTINNIFGRAYDAHLNLFSEELLKTDPISINLFETILLKYVLSYNINLQETLLAKFSYKHVNFVDNPLLSSDRIKAGYFNETINTKPELSKYLTKPNNFVSFSIDFKNLSYFKELFANKFNLNVFILNNSALYKNATSNFLNLFSYDFTKKYNQLLNVNNFIDFGKKYYQSLYIYNHLYQGEKQLSKLFMNRTNDLFEKRTYDLNLYHTLDSGKPRLKNLNRFNDYDFAQIINKSFGILEPGSFFSKNKYIMNILQAKDFMSKNIKFLRMYLDDLFLDKSIHTLKLFDVPTGICKEYNNLQLDEYHIYDIMKDLLPLTLYSDQDYSIISINKINSYAFIKDFILFLIANAKETNYGYHEDITTTKLELNIDLYNDSLICDKLAQNINFITTINESIYRNRIHTWFINQDIFVDKTLYDISYYKQPKLIKKTIDKIFIQDQKPIYKKISDLVIYEQQENFSKITKELALFYERKAFDYYKLAFINQDPVTFLTVFRDLFKNPESNYDHIFKTSKNMDLYQIMRTLSRISVFDADADTFNEHYLMDKKLFLDVFPEIQDIFKIAKEGNIVSDERLDWAWCYQDDEPFDDPFKIDELLLPENDSRYEDFENIIFNRETGKPRSPVQEIDDYTFVAKFPNHYPIKDENGENAYKDVAVQYLDVRTSIMRKVFLGYYQVWQDNIFEFAKMTIPQSAKKMLDYLYAWILMNFPEEDIPEALRTFRLIRWYLERGIIETSEYYITYEPDDLTSGKLDTTNLAIPNDMMSPPDPDDPINNTMYIDTGAHVIRNNPNKLHQEAHITFYLENKRDTTISFNLHTFTPVYIILNGEIIDTISLPTTAKMVYNIPYTGEMNKFTIQKLAVDNNDNYFFIGNIKIEGMGTTGDLNIDFNPKIQGNKVLNHVSQKVIAYMNLYEDNQNLIQNLLKGNVHLSEVYEQLLEYWNIHHQEKDKGKRLTIKRT